MEAIPQETIDRMVQLAREALQHAYCPYSNFRVACALLTSSDELYTGVNVENAAFAPGICAERVAVVKAVSEGRRGVKAVMITSDAEGFTSPCGVCRQTLREFGADMWVFMCTKTLKVKTCSLAELLPLSFGPDDIAAPRSE